MAFYDHIQSHLTTKKGSTVVISVYECIKNMYIPRCAWHNMVNDLAGLYCYIQIKGEEIVHLVMNTTHLSFNLAQGF